METVNHMSGIVLAVMVVLMFVMAVFRYRSSIRKSQYSLILWFIFSVFLIWVYTFDFKSFIRWDLLEHYKELSLFRANDWKYAWSHGQYKALYISNLYFYLISRLPNNRLFSVIPVFIDFSVFWYIFKDGMRIHGDNNNYSFWFAFFTTVIWFGTFGMKLAISGVRCVTAVALTSLAIYLEYVKQRKRLTAYFLYLCAVFIHYFALVVVVFRLLMTMRNRLLMFFGVFFAIVIGPSLFPALMRIVPNAYVQDGMALFTKYWGRYSIFRQFSSVSTSVQTVYICMVLMTGYLGYVSSRSAAYLRWTGAEGNDELYMLKDRLCRIAQTLAICAAACAFNYLIIERVMYMVAYVLVMILPMYLHSRNRNHNVDVLALMVLVWLWFFNDIYIFLVNITGVYFLAV